MSKGGGAGKVYFILYLAVLLELLIIIVERDDAEDELRKEKLALGRHTKIAGTIGDLYTTLFDGVMGIGLGKVPTANRQLTEILV